MILAALLVRVADGQTLLPGAERLVDVIELTDHDDQADIWIHFNCSLGYITHLPQVEGGELRLQLRPLPDCGITPGSQIASELPPLSGGENIISAARVESDIPGQVTISITFKKTERWVVAQGPDQHGIRVRLIDRARRSGKILLSDTVDAVANFAVNLDSQLKPYDQAAIDAAAQRLKLPAYVAQVTVDEQHWYRLRVGPIERQSEAQRVLNAALPYYPRAWVAIGDDTTTTSAAAGGEAAAVAGVERIGSDPALAPAVLAQLVADARAAMARRDYPQAIKLLTKLQRQPEFSQRADMQELLGLAHEHSGHLAQAKAEYEEYLFRYPNGPAAERVRERLRVLHSADEAAHGFGTGSANAGGWSFVGSFGQMYRYDGTRIASTQGNTSGGATTGGPVNTTQSTSQNALYNDVDFLARDRGERYGMVLRFSGGYARDFGNNSALSSASPNLRRISLASVDLTDANWGLLTRLGRQTRNEGGVLGTFDGALLAWQWSPTWNLNATVGLPVEQTSDGLNSQRRFEALALAFTPPGWHWDADVYVTEQQFGSFLDRRAVGFDARYLMSRLSLAALFDYDLFYHSINSAALLGTLQLPGRWNLSFDAERRNAPVLMTGNALIGQPDTQLTQLLQLFTVPQIDQLARDRTAISSNYALTATRPLGERLQFALTATADRIGPTADSGGVAATPDTGLETSYQAQLYGSDLLMHGDFDVLSLAHSKTEIGLIDDLGLTTRFPLGGAWRLGPRFNFERRQISADNSRELDLLPSFLLDYQRARILLQFELGGEIGSRDALLESQNTRRYYISAAYRIAF